MKKGVYIRRKVSILAFFMFGLMLVSCIGTIIADSIRPKVIMPNVKGLNLRDADISDYNGELNPDVVVSSKKVDQDARVLVIIEVDDNSLANNYISYADTKFNTLNDYVSSNSGQSYALNMKTRQETLFNRLSEEFNLEYKYSYSSFLNGFAAYVRYGDIAAIEKNEGVRSVIISEKYDAPDTFEVVTSLPSQSETASTSSSSANAGATNEVKVYKETGIYDTSDSGYDGSGMIVAILDTGLDYNHPAFTPFQGAHEVRFTKADVAEKLANNPFAAGSLSSGLTADDVYVNNKVPYGYDYADKDSEVFPVNNHGTHVAGIVAGKDSVITGAAVGAQIAVMKVFSNEDGGGESADILAAVEDCVHLDVDIINMSLGSTAGFARDEDYLKTNEVYDLVHNSGVNLFVSAGNEYSSGFGSAYGLNRTMNPDSGTIGSPASYAASLSVASISGIKTPYLLADGVKPIYFYNASDNNGEQIKFLDRLLVDGAGNPINEKEFEYVVIPGIGTTPNYAGLDVKGKIAVVKRGIDTFVDKAKVAESFGAAGVIIYNNVSGVITMSLGKEKIIPACSITLELGTYLEEQATKNGQAGKGYGGKIVLSRDFEAGPFMSGFSSWGPLPDLELKPEITAHGGDILSALMGGGHIQQSGTSMSAPNLAGAATLLKQHLKENVADYGLTANDSHELRALVNQLLMSTATIAITEDSKPYSPRKQGAGLADLNKAINTRAYIYTKNADGSIYDKTKLSIGDDKDRKGEYVLEFFVKNMDNLPLSYNLGTIVMTEEISADGKTVAEIPHLLDDSITNVTVSDASYNASNKVITIDAGKDAHVKVTVKLTDSAKKHIDDNFKNGMFVEGFVTLKTTLNNGINLNIPWLGFYGDWTDAPILDKTYYETSKDEIDDTILDHLKVKADVRPIVPIGQILRNNGADELNVFMGAQAYTVADMFSEVPAYAEKTAMSLESESVYMLYGISGFLRGAKDVDVKITNAFTGQVMIEQTYQNARKSSVSNWGVIDFNDEIDIRQIASDAGVKFVEGGKYVFEMQAFLDYGDGKQGNRNTFTFDFYVDSVAPEIKDINLKIEKDKNHENVKRFLELDVFDSNYVMAADVLVYDPNYGSYVTVFGKGVMPVNTERNTVSHLTVPITNYWDYIVQNDYEIKVMIVDYAFNHRYQYVNLRERYNSAVELSFDSKYTSSNPLLISTFEERDLRNLMAYVASNTKYRAWDEDFTWESSDPETISVDDKKGKILGLKPGEAVITVSSETTDATAQINVKVLDSNYAGKQKITPNSLTLNFTSLELTAGSEYKVKATMNPHVITDDYRIVWTSNRTNWATVIQDPSDITGMQAIITAIDEGSALIKATLQTRARDSEGNPVGDWVDSASATCNVIIPELFVVNFHILQKYNGNQKVVHIPDGLGINIIGSSAFMFNEFIEEVHVPHGVSQIENAAFAYCRNLKKVYLPATLITIGEWAFAARVGRDPNLENNGLGGAPHTSLTDVIIATYPDGSRSLRTVGARAFVYAQKLTSLDFRGVTSIGSGAFLFCNGLVNIDLSTVKAIGEGAFADCINLKFVTFARGATIGPHAFNGDYNLGNLVLPVSRIEQYAFVNCSDIDLSVGIRSVSFTSPDSVFIGRGAFMYCLYMENITFSATVKRIEEGAFAANLYLQQVTLPDGLEYLGSGAFLSCWNLRKITFPAGAKVSSFDGPVFEDCRSLEQIVVENGNNYLVSDGRILYSKNDGSVLMSAPKAGIVNYKVPDEITKIAPFAFAGNVTMRSINLNKVTHIGEAAFASCYSSADSVGLVSVTYSEHLVEIDKNAFMDNHALQSFTFVPIQVSVNNLEKIGAGAFARCEELVSFTTPEKVSIIEDETFLNCLALEDITFEGTITRIGEYAFTGTAIDSIDLSNVTSVGAYAFMFCENLATVDLSKAEVISTGAFANCSSLSISALPLAKTIGSYAFSCVPGITSINLPKAETIGAYAFAGYFVNPLYSDSEYRDVGAIYSTETVTADTNITAILNLDQVKFIGVAAFRGSKVTSVNIPSSLEIMHPYAFAECENLTEYIVNANNKNFFASNGVLYRNVPSGFELVAYPANKTGESKSMTIGGTSVTVDYYKVIDKTVRIEAGAFIGNNNIEVVNLPYGLMSLGHEAFYDCSRLSLVEFNSYEAPALEADLVFFKEIVWAANDFYRYEDFMTGVASYRNFVIDIAEQGEDQRIALTYPNNGIGYDGYMYSLFFGELTRTNEIVMSYSTANFISAVQALPAIADLDYERDKDVVASLRIAYGFIPESQRVFIPAAILETLAAAEARIEELTPVEGGGDPDKPGCGCGTIAPFAGGLGGMILGGGIMILAMGALLFVFMKRSNKSVKEIK